MDNDKFIYILYICVLILFSIMIYSDIYDGGKISKKTQCQLDCYNGLLDTTDWTCVKSCMEIK